MDRRRFHRRLDAFHIPNIVSPHQGGTTGRPGLPRFTSCLQQAPMVQCCTVLSTPKIVRFAVLGMTEGPSVDKVFESNNLPAQKPYDCHRQNAPKILEDDSEPLFPTEPGHEDHGLLQNRRGVRRNQWLGPRPCAFRAFSMGGRGSRRAVFAANIWLSRPAASSAERSPIGISASLQLRPPNDHIAVAQQRARSYLSKQFRLSSCYADISSLGLASGLLLPWRD